MRGRAAWQKWDQGGSGEGAEGEIAQPLSPLILQSPVVSHCPSPSGSQLARGPCEAAHRDQPPAGLRVWVEVQIENNNPQICLKNCHPDGISGRQIFTGLDPVISL